jgi:hypothetical protein
MVTMDDDAVANSLAILGSLDEAGTDRRVARFRGRLRELRDDPAEAARIDALVAGVEQEEQASDAMPGNGLTIYVNGGVVNVHQGEGNATAVREDAEERLAAMELELKRLRRDLKAALKEVPSRSRPRRPWEVVLAPALGAGVLVAILAAAAVTTALHSAVVALTIIASVLTVATAAVAFLSAWMPFTSVRELNRQGHAALALQLLSRGTSASRFTAHADDEGHAGSGIARTAGYHSPSAPEERPRRLSICPSCRQQLHPNDDFCGNCGSSAFVAG